MKHVSTLEAQRLLGDISYAKLRALTKEGLIRQPSKGRYSLGDINRLGLSAGDQSKMPVYRVVATYDVPESAEMALLVSGVKATPAATPLEALSIARADLWPVIVVSHDAWLSHRAFWYAVEDRCTLVVLDDDEWNLGKFVAEVWEGVRKRWV